MQIFISASGSPAVSYQPAKVHLILSKYPVFFGRPKRSVSAALQYHIHMLCHGFHNMSHKHCLRFRTLQQNFLYFCGTFFLHCLHLFMYNNVLLLFRHLECCLMHSPAHPRFPANSQCWSWPWQVQCSGSRRELTLPFWSRYFLY